jgi:predicted unusual protein kinase regulating ubiquinone biosynthesis (AarF/ABC1/UbiB family)
MKTNLSDLIAALPEDEVGPEVLQTDEARKRLEAIFADVAQRPVPTGSWHRLWTLGELSTQVTLAYAALWFRQLFADADARERRAMETNLRVALKMIHRLGYLRGAATKLGQLLGNLPEILPDQVVSTLDMLHFQAPPMHFSLLREAVRNELGKDPSELFASFEKEPFAAASIGQVHRATLKSGESVAVKIQYPGIGRSIAADIRNWMAIMFPMRLTRQWAAMKAHAEAVQRMLELEADYEQEAQNMRDARALFEPADGIVVPRVYSEYSTSRVLTSDFLHGKLLQEFVAGNPAQPLRDEFGRKIKTAWDRMYYAFMSYADPHSGNYVFMDDGRLGLLDFGCIQRFTPEERVYLQRIEQVLDGELTPADLLRFDTYVTEADLANPDLVATSEREFNAVMAPLLQKGVFDFGDAQHFKNSVDAFKELLRKRYTAGHPMHVYLHRACFGLGALLLRLRCRVDLREIRRLELERQSRRGLS